MKIQLEQEVIEAILKQDSQMLATHVVVYRTIGSCQEEAKLAMMELMRRRIQENDSFNFEEFIKNDVENTKIQLKTPSVTDMKREIIKSITDNLFNYSSTETEEIPSEEESYDFDEKTKLDLQEVLEQLKIITS